MKYLILLAVLIASGCTKTIYVYHYFPDTIYIDQYQLTECPDQ